MTGPDGQPTYGSGAYWRTRTDEQLQYLVDGSMVGSRAHDGAMAEIERRKAEKDQERQLFWIKLTFWTTVVLGAGGIAASALS